MLTREQRTALILAGFIIGATALPVLAAVFSDPVPQSGTVPYETNSGVIVRVSGTTNTSSGNPFPDDNTVDIKTEQGNATITGNGGANITIATTEITGTWTNVTQINVTKNEVKIDPEDKPAFNISGDLDNVSVHKNPQIDDGNIDFRYAGTSGKTNITLRGLPANTELIAVDQNGNAVGGGQTDGSGTLVLEDMPNSDHKVTLQSNDGDPQLSDPQPTGPRSGFPTKLNVTVDDADFPNDNVTVTFYLDGTKQGQDSVQSKGTAEVTISNPGRGAFDVKASAEDQAGNVVNLTWSFQTPRFLNIRNESNASQKILDNVKVNLVFYSQDGVTIATRNTTNGTIDLAGLPPDEYATTFRANTTWYDRTNYYENTTGFNQSAYLLNSTEHPDAKTVEFILDDRTGRFTRDNSRIIIQRALDPDDDGNVTWEKVAADRWNAAGAFFFTGENATRYRVIVENDDETRRIIGHYEIVESRQEVVKIGNVEWPAINGTATFYRANISYTPVTASTKPVIAIQYADAANRTKSFDVKIYERDNTSNVIFSDSVSGNVSRYYAEANVTTNQAENKTWIVEIQYQYQNQIFTQKRIVGTQTTDFPIDPDFLSGVVMVAIPVLLGLYGPRNWQYGLIMVFGFIGVAMMLQWVQIPIAAYAIGLVIVAGGILKTEATRS